LGHLGQGETGGATGDQLDRHFGKLGRGGGGFDARYLGEQNRVGNESNEGDKPFGDFKQLPLFDFSFLFSRRIVLHFRSVTLMSEAAAAR
jgi:hypothetical protein